jgi:uncharacterized protein
MLRSFRVSNHKSIRDEIELLLAPVYEKENPVVPVAAIFGANASGKSNFIDALSWMQQAVRRSYTSWEAESGVPRTPFRLDVHASLEPSLYVVDLVLDEVQYVYGFSVTDQRIYEEWLYSYPHKHKRVIFERTRDRVEFGSTIPERRGRSELLTSFTRDNSLLLSAAVQAKQEEVLPVYNWFRDGLRQAEDRRADRRVGGSARMVDRVARAVDRHPQFVELLRAADLGITDLQVLELQETPSAVAIDRADRLEREIAALDDAMDEASPAVREDLARHAATLRDDARSLRSARRRRELLFLHGPDKVALATEEQSEGTLSWMTLLLHSLDALATGAAIVVDEIDSSLHPRLTARLIELFRSPESNPNGGQVIFTTHDATLLSTSFGRDILKRDEVWFVEKAADGATSLFPLSDFRPRKDENTERRYLGGSYGAVPSVFSGSFVEAMRAVRTESDNGTP